jgi:hypothetical protein
MSPASKLSAPPRAGEQDGSINLGFHMGFANTTATDELNKPLRLISIDAHPMQRFDMLRDVIGRLNLLEQIVELFQAFLKYATAQGKPRSEPPETLD